MGEYLDGQTSKSNINISQQNIDINAIAQAVAKAIGSNTKYYNAKGEVIDDFNNNATMEKLANAMIMQKDSSQSNFKDLGETKRVKKDDTQSTIDMLSKLGD